MAHHPCLRCSPLSSKGVVALYTALQEPAQPLSTPRASAAPAGCMLQACTTYSTPQPPPPSKTHTHGNPWSDLRTTHTHTASLQHRQPGRLPSASPEACPRQPALPPLRPAGVGCDAEGWAATSRAVGCAQRAGSYMWATWGTRGRAVPATLAPGWSPPHPRTPLGGTHSALPSDHMLLQRSSWCQRACATTSLQPYSSRPCLSQRSHQAWQAHAGSSSRPAPGSACLHARFCTCGHCWPRETWPPPLRRHHTAAAAGAAMTTCLTRLWLRLRRIWPQRNPPHAGPCAALTSPQRPTRLARHPQVTARRKQTKQRDTQQDAGSTKAMHASSTGTHCRLTALVAAQVNQEVPAMRDSPAGAHAWQRLLPPAAPRPSGGSRLMRAAPPRQLQQQARPSTSRTQARLL